MAYGPSSWAMAWMETFVPNVSPGANRMASGVSIWTVTPRTWDTSGITRGCVGGATGGRRGGVAGGTLTGVRSLTPASSSSS
uniref:Uncharacterized protein n=1 Tax=Human herpesvirus 2 TaxID=10310 RepID=A0A481TX52_HHV2|nr:hypothetical protein [Human alphaherpesvirus 2]